MITHINIKIALHGQDETLWRELYVPPFLYLDDLATIINLCFGWPDDIYYTFTGQEPQRQYFSEKRNDLSIFQGTDTAETVMLQDLFGKDQAAVYQYDASAQLQIDLTLKTTIPLLLPAPTLQLKHWQGDTVPSPTGGTVLLQENTVKNALLQLQATYFEDFFSNESHITVDLQEIKNALFGGSFQKLLQDMPEEEATQMLEDFVKHMETEASRSYTLQQCLETLRKEDLVEIARANHFRGYSKLRRDQLIDFLQKHLLQPDFVRQQILRLTLSETMGLQQLLQGNLPIFSSDSYRNLYIPLNHGLCYTDLYERFFILPRELKLLVQETLEDEDVSTMIYAHNIIYVCCFTAVYMFGVYPVEKLLQHVQTVLETPITMDDFQQLAMAPERAQQEYAFVDDYLVDKILQLPEEAKNLAALKKMQQSSTKPVFWPDLDTMLQLADEGWLIQKDLYAAFVENFEPYLNPEIHDIEEAMRTIERLIRTGVNFSSIITALTKHCFQIPNLKLSQQLVSDLQQIWNETPMWSNNGFSPNKLRQQTSKQKADNVVSLASHRKKKKKKKR